MSGEIPAECEDEEDPYRELVLKMKRSMDRMHKYIDSHNWHELERDVLLMKLYVEEAKEIRERWEECS